MYNFMIVSMYRQIRFNSQLNRDTSLLLLSWLVLIDHSSYPTNIPTRTYTVLHCPSGVTPKVSEDLASIDNDDDRFPVLLVPFAQFMW